MASTRGTPEDAVLDAVIPDVIVSLSYLNAASQRKMEHFVH